MFRTALQHGLLYYTVSIAAVDKRLEKMELRFAKSLDELTKTLDKFLKRVTDIEEEFIFMKEDLRRVKAVLREKLGVSLD